MSYIKDLSETIYNKLQESVQKLYTNKRFIEDAKKEYVLNKNVEHTPLTEDDKRRIVIFITDTIDCNAVKRHYNFLVEMRRKHIDSDFDFISDKIINNIVKVCSNFYIDGPYFSVYASLFKEFKDVCRTPGKMPKIVRQIYTPNSWNYKNFEKSVNEDGTYNLDGTGIYFEN